jgi:outer membrane receptor protein involved in Fe transport
VRRSGAFDDITWRLVTRYTLSDDLSIWASYARGRRPDVISATPGQAPGSSALTTITPAEEVDSLELGLRGQALGGALLYDASVFTYEYANFQTTAFQGLQIVTINAGSASAIGFEGSVFWRAGDLLEMFSNYAYNDAQFDSGARKGNRFRLSPEHSVALGATVSAPLWGHGVLRVTPSVTYQSDVFFDDNNDRATLQQPLFPTLADTTVDERQDGYALVNLRLAYTPENSAVEIGAFIANLTDEDYLLDAGNTGDTLGLPTFVRGAPRMVGFEVKAKY